MKEKIIILIIFFAIKFFPAVASYQFKKNDNSHKYWFIFSGEIFSTTPLFPIKKIKNKIFKYSYFLKTRFFFF